MITFIGACFYLHFSVCQKTNLVPSSRKDLKDKKFLLRKDIQIGEDVLIVSMRWSKTIQFGERVLKTPLVKIPDSVLCPVKAFKIMCSKVKAKPEDPLFTLPEKKCITYQSFQKKLRGLVQKIGLEPESFSSHSFRRGGTSFAFRCRVPTELIQLHGDWRSDAYKKYLSLSLEDKLLVAHKMRQHILLK